MTHDDDAATPVEAPDPQRLPSEEAWWYFLASALGSVVVVIFVGAVIYGVSFDSSREGIDSAPAQAVDGAEVFAERCAVCHGRQGLGGVGPSFVGVTERLVTVADQQAVVRNGRNAMPSFSGTLSDAEIEAVVDYERTVLDGGSAGS